jgi:hypothetical protein
VTYLDADHKPTTAGNYTYKRVIKYKEPVMNLNVGTDYYGNITANPRPTGLHICSITDYYKTGEPALVGNVVAGDVSCSQLGGFDGQVVAFYKNGNIKRKEPWKAGKLNGVVISYNEDGTELKREEYENGELVDENKFAVSSNNPLVGTWKFVQYFDRIQGTNLPPRIKLALTITFSQNGVVRIIVQDSLSSRTESRNWKYIPQGDLSGIIEEYLGDEMFERVKVRWIDRDQFEYTVTFHQNANNIGNRFLFTRQ